MMLSNFYVDNYNYQENLLPRMNKIDGNDVLIVASTETFVENMRLGYLNPGEYYNNDGIRVVRVPYNWFPLNPIKHKIRSYKNIDKILEEFKPDIILFHGACAWELINVSRYKSKNSNVKLYVDSHEDFNNSAKNFISRQILHKFFYKTVIQTALPYIDKILCVGYECFAFLKEMYDVPDDMMEFFPLGGNIFKDIIRIEKRSKIRASLSLRDSDLLLVHSGKMDKQKKTAEIVEAFLEADLDNLFLIIIGSMTNDVSEELIPLIDKTAKIHYLGWKNAEELLDYLCASDLYVQPGGQSATMQNALCCGSAAALYPHESHKYLLGESVFYIETVEDMKKLFELISKDPQKLEDKRKMSFKIAQEKLDYKKLAARLYE
jgi:glycosyltransferase involved in cell wall biosynthesis